MNREQYLLGKLAEEASEIAQIALKTQQFGFESFHPETKVTNISALNGEINDLLTILELLRAGGYMNYVPDQNYILDKSEKINKYYQLSRDCGRTL